MRLLRRFSIEGERLHPRNPSSTSYTSKRQGHKKWRMIQRRQEREREADGMAHVNVVPDTHNMSHTISEYGNQMACRLGRTLIPTSVFIPSSSSFYEQLSPLSTSSCAFGRNNLSLGLRRVFVYINSPCQRLMFMGISQSYSAGIDCS